MFTIENGNRYLAQWDTGQRLIIDDREITEVHFAKGTNVAAVMQVTTEGDRRVVKVPNICLQSPNDLAVFFVITTPDGRSNTVHFSTIRVVRRPRPDDYVETEDEVLRWTTLASTIGSLTDLQTVEKTNLVAAINEVLKKVDTGGSIDPATIAQAVDDYLSENPVQEKDPTVPAWAKEAEKPSYTAQEVGADPSGTAAGLVAAHNTAEAAHNDIRLLISGLTDRLNALADSDDTTLDQLSEVVAYIKANRELLASITTDKVSVSDIIDNLTTNVSNKPLSAAQGVALKALIDAISIPDKLPSPNALTFTGAATGSYDGSKPFTVNIPSLAVDDSLTMAGQAADAAAVGNRLSSLSEEIDTTSESKVSAHNTGTDAHSDIRLLISVLKDRLNALADSDDTTLDQLSEVVAYIKSNRGLIDAITTSKVSVADIVDNLTTNIANKPLSAAQGVALKALIDSISVPDKLPNPNALMFTGAVTGSYDGSAPVSVEIPSGGGYTWEETVLASGTLVADTTVDYDTGITLAMLREYKSFVYRLRGASNVVLSNLYLMLDNPYQSIDRSDASGRIVVYEWADAAKTVLYMKSGYAANSSMVFIDKNFAWATNQPQGYTSGAYSPIRYIDVSALQETDRLKFYCANVPKINYAFDIRGLTK